MKQPTSALVTCPQCQTQFRVAADQAGKQTRCANRACGAMIDVPTSAAAGKAAPPAPAPIPIPAGLLRISCSCGRTFQAGPELAGKRVKCNSCGNLLLVPGGSRQSPTAPPARPPAPAAEAPILLELDTPAPAAPRRSAWPWLGGGAIGGVMAAGALVAVWLILGGPRRLAGDALALQAAELEARNQQIETDNHKLRQQLAALEKAFQEVEAAEKEAGDDLEKAIAAWQRFLVEHANATTAQRDAARKKIEVELPTRIDDRDYLRALQAAEAVGFEPGKAAGFLQKYLQQHPQGRHAAEAQQLLAGDLAKRADDLMFSAARTKAASAGDNHEAAIAAYEGYLKRFPEGKHAEAARNAIAASNAKRTAQADDRAFASARAKAQAPGAGPDAVLAAYRDYLGRFPQGRHAAAAKAGIDAALPKLEEHEYQKLLTQLKTAEGREQEAAAACTRFLERFAGGRRAPEVQKQLDDLNRKLALAAPPPLPPFPKNLGWEKYDLSRLETTVAEYPTNQVSACLVFDAMLKRDKKGPTAAQRDWLQKAEAVARPRALEVLKRDYRAAIANLDLRNAVIVSSVAERMQKDSLADEKAALATVRNHVLTGKGMANPVWKVSEVKGQFLKGSYGEGFGGNQISITPNKGFHLLRVKGKAENLSAVSELPYWHWSLGGLRGAFADGSFDKKPDKPIRRALDDFLFLLTPANDLLNCSHVCEGCSALRGSLQVRTDSGIICTGSWVEQGSSIDLDILFSVPQGIDNLRLLMLGTTPVPVDLAKP